jgi:hypothetical protein
VSGGGPQSAALTRKWQFAQNTLLESVQESGGLFHHFSTRAGNMPDLTGPKWQQRPLPMGALVRVLDGAGHSSAPVYGRVVEYREHARQYVVRPAAAAAAAASGPISGSRVSGLGGGLGGGEQVVPVGLVVLAAERIAHAGGATAVGFELWARTNPQVTIGGLGAGAGSAPHPDAITLGVMVAGNSGRPGGATGGTAGVMARAVHPNHSTQEEDVLSNWLVTTTACGHSRGAAHGLRWPREAQEQVLAPALALALALPLPLSLFATACCGACACRGALAALHCHWLAGWLTD